MPCDTNNDASDSVCGAPHSFSCEETTTFDIMKLTYNHESKRWVHADDESNFYYFTKEDSDEEEEDDDFEENENDSEDNDEEEFENQIVQQEILFDRLIFHSARGSTTDLGYLDPCSDYFVRKYEYDYDWGCVEEIDEINVGLCYSPLSNNITAKENERFTCEYRNNMLNFKIIPEDYDYRSKYDILNILKEFEEEIHSQTLNEIIDSNDMKLDLHENYLAFVNDHVILSVFDFLDTCFLLKTCSKVSSEWHKLLFYNSQTQNHIFKSILLNYLKSDNIDKNMARLNEYYNLNWLDTYLMSGMLVFEMFQDELERQLEPFTNLNAIDEGRFLYIVLKLDPIPHLIHGLGENHALISRLKLLQPKRVLFSMNTLADVKKMLFKRGFLSNIISSENNCDVKSIISSILKAKCENPIGDGKFSVDFKKGISLYDEYLKEIAPKLASFRIPSTRTNPELDWAAQCLCEMKEKAKYFIQNIIPHHPFTKFCVDGDILLGMHLLLLDNIYSKIEFIDNIPFSLNFSELLENRKNVELTSSNSVLPEKFQTNLFELLLQKDPSSTQYQFTTESIEPFNNSSNVLEFITEHLIELSEIHQDSVRPFSDWIEKDIGEYYKFINTVHYRSITPPKHVDLIFHFHMLHPNNYVQDCLRIAKSIKNHKFSFTKQQ